MSVVIGGQDGPYGVLGVHTTRARTFTTDDVSFLQSIANVLASAVERTRAEEAVRESEVRFQTILDTASDAIISIDNDQRIILFNQQDEKMFGYQAEEVLGDTLGMLLPDALRDTHPAHIDDFVEEGVSQRQMSERPELLAQRKNGETFPTEVTLSRLDLGKQRVLTAIVRDVTERRKAENSVRESEKRYHNLFEQFHRSPCGRRTSPPLALA